jgi:SOS-response transcriptional repressor LexA
MDTGVDPVRQLIRNALVDRHLNMSSVSKQLGKNHAYMHQFLDRRIPATLPETVREKLAQILNVPEARLKHQGGEVVGGSPGRVRSVFSAGGDKIPVLGGGPDEADGWSIWSAELIEHVSRPPQLAGVTQGYALYVGNSTMEPRFFPGELVYVHPGKPVTPKAFVLVQLKGEKEAGPTRAAIRRLIKRTATKVTIEQINPPRELELKASDVASMHRIVGSAESSGL